MDASESGIASLTDVPLGQERWDVETVGVAEVLTLCGAALTRGSELGRGGGGAPGGKDSACSNGANVKEGVGNEGAATGGASSERSGPRSNRGQEDAGGIGRIGFANEVNASEAAGHEGKMTAASAAGEVDRYYFPCPCRGGGVGADASDVLSGGIDVAKSRFGVGNEGAATGGASSERSGPRSNRGQEDAEHCIWQLSLEELYTQCLSSEVDYHLISPFLQTQPGECLDSPSGCRTGAFASVPTELSCIKCKGGHLGIVLIEIL
ncbi:hypothetical protein B0H16DRAFT_1457173 [Mycena metata]|uniref:Uncharacterized protein n=1 Tax=Mycena metata TaxID=1033252 RepID=A0AAD7J777_9AGAR|nr:hypothetical protein B0H16DRAFT_1457173 [Mycena metata]